MDIFGFDPGLFSSFLLTFMRVSIILFMLPFFGGDTLPRQIKGLICLVLTFAIFPKLSFPPTALPGSLVGLILVMASEACLGLCLGLAVHFIFAAIQTGGQLIGTQMGFSMVNLIDPLSGAQGAATANFLYMVALTIFLCLDGHLHLLRAIADSFSLVPAGSFIINATLTKDMLFLSAEMFVLATKIAAPAFAALFMVEMTMALMGRAAPQMNLMTMGFPIKIAVGMFFLGLLFTVLSVYMEDFIISIEPLFERLMKSGVKG